MNLFVLELDLSLFSSLASYLPCSQILILTQMTSLLLDLFHFCYHPVCCIEIMVIRHRSCKSGTKPAARLSCVNFSIIPTIWSRINEWRENYTWCNSMQICFILLVDSPTNSRLSGTLQSLQYASLVSFGSC